MGGVFPRKFISELDQAEYTVNFYILDRDIPIAFSTQTRWRDMSITSSGAGDYDLKRYITFEGGTPGRTDLYDARQTPIFGVRTGELFHPKNNEAFTIDADYQMGHIKHNGEQIITGQRVYGGESYPFYVCIEPSQLVNTERLFFMTWSGAERKYYLYGNANPLLKKFLSTEVTSLTDSIQDITLELHDSVSQEVVRMFTSDDNRKLRIRFTDGGKPFRINDERVPTQVVVYCNETTVLGATMVYEEEYAEISMSIGALKSGIYNCIAQVVYGSGAERRLYNSPKFTLIIEKGIENDD